MSFRDAQARRRQQARERQRRVRLERFAALGSLILVAGVLVVVVLSSTQKSGSGATKAGSTHSSGAGSASGRASRPATTSTPSAAGRPGTATVPILAYHVINTAPPQRAGSDLYVPADEFSSQMQALKAAGWHAVTLNQLQAYWTRGVSLGPGKPIVISFDDGYASQYTTAVPVLKRLGWVGVENLQLNGLPASEGGLTDTQIRGLIAAGWELDSEGTGNTDLVGIDPNQLQAELSTARQTLRTRYKVPVNWFNYPLGHYDPTVTAAVRAAGFVGAMTTVSGWASPQDDRFRLPRLRVVGGTTGPELLSQIDSAKTTTSVPTASSGAGVA